MTTRRPLVTALLIPLAGCQLIFKLSDVPVDGSPGDDGGGDDGVVEQPCWDEGLTNNEDLDLEVDGCDNCPAIKNDGQANADGDEVGDACDPHPNLDDEILYFEGFSNLGASSAWQTKGGNWQIQDGQYKQLLSAGDAVAVHGGLYTNATVEIFYSGVDDPTTGIKQAGAYLWTVSQTPMSQTPPGVRCFESRKQGGDQLVIRDEPNTFEVPVQLPGDRALTTRLRIVSKPEGFENMIYCEARRGDKTLAPIMSGHLSSPGYVALHTTGTRINVHSVFVTALKSDE